ncbi:hypothetical protein V9T40_011178 [Parthenolecanium corni]|uniref:Uncharacterized protein n=1 Tax=Parthenolecanium corni TaxID=536013 RepID=A0AAN9XY59_9HEMI
MLSIILYLFPKQTRHKRPIDSVLHLALTRTINRKIFRINQRVDEQAERADIDATYPHTHVYIQSYIHEYKRCTLSCENASTHAHAPSYGTAKPLASAAAGAWRRIYRLISIFRDLYTPFSPPVPTAGEAIIGDTEPSAKAARTAAATGAAARKTKGGERGTCSSAASPVGLRNEIRRWSNRYNPPIKINRKKKRGNENCVYHQKNACFTRPPKSPGGVNTRLHKIVRIARELTAGCGKMLDNIAWIASALSMPYRTTPCQHRKSISVL